MSRPLGLTGGSATPATDDSITRVVPARSQSTAQAFDNGLAWVIVELAPDGIIVANYAGRIMMANGQIEALFGYDRDALVGAQVESLLPPRLRRVHESHRVAYANAPRLRAMGSGLELFGCRADGSEFPIEVSLSPVASNHGIVTVVVVRDVTEQRALERAARTAPALDRDQPNAADPRNRFHLDGLTTQEFEVLRHVALGYTNAETARLVGMSMRTVESRRSSVQHKLDVQTRAEFVRFALENGLLYPEI